MIQVHLQTQAADCGEACLRMMASAFGRDVSAQQMRAIVGQSGAGIRLPALVAAAGRIGLQARPLRLDLPELRALQTPCILHWDLNHYVVLERIGSRGRVHVIDPACGRRTLTMADISQHFTGVAVEFTLAGDWSPPKATERVSVTRLLEGLPGLRPALGHLLVLSVALQLFALASPLVGQTIVDQVLVSHDRHLLAVLLIGFSIVLLLQTALSALRGWISMRLTQVISLHLAGRVFGHLLRLPIAYFERRQLGDIASRLGSIGPLQHFATLSLIEAVLDGLVVTLSLAMMLLYAPMLAMVACAAAVAYLALRIAAFQPFRDAAAERLVLSARQSSYFLETLRGIQAIALSGRSDDRRVKLQNLIVDVQNRDTRTARMSLQYSLAQLLIFGAENIAVLWLAAGMVMAGGGSHGPTFTVGMLMAFLAYKGQFTGRVSALIDLAIEWRMLALHGERLGDIVLETPEQDNVPRSELAHLVPSLELRGVSFRYGESEPWVLRHVDLRVEAGEHLALIGPSGAGKTTLMKLLLGILQPQEGEVCFGGVPIGQLGLSNVRRQMGVVMQDDALLSGSLAENICFFDDQPDQARIEACARAAHVHEDVLRLPMGYHTLVGDMGVGLSGGQKQRLLLARALYRQPRVLALDEATSHLDVANERAVSAALADLAVTRLVIAHRPETIAAAQRVVRVAGGRVEEVLPNRADALALPTFGTAGPAGTAEHLDHLTENGDGSDGI